MPSLLPLMPVSDLQHSTAHHSSSAKVEENYKQAPRGRLWQSTPPKDRTCKNCD